ncbi:MAG TPA: glycosyltransferase family 2 protein [Bryobacteraceae bacterium]|jgi:glycosyltransferase involved in cell wall biosynthesis
MPRISVIIATHNRADMVRIALQSLIEQTVNRAAFEVIVVDNASRDHTASMVAEMSARMPHLRYAREERLGLSWARNRGLAEAQAPYIAYLDDDACAEPVWVDALLAALESPSAPQCVAGPVYLNWNGLPQNVPARYWSLLSYVHYGDRDRPLTATEYVVGANMAFDRAALDRVGGFPTNLGRHGSKLLSGEEAQVVAQIRAGGGEVHYAANAGVFHIVQPDRVKRVWLWRRMFWDGASQPVLDGAARQPRSYCALQAYRDVKRIGFFILRSAAACFCRDRDGRLDCALRATQRAGRLRTHLRLLLGVAS